MNMNVTAVEIFVPYIYCNRSLKNTKPKKLTKPFVKPCIA